MKAFFGSRISDNIAKTPEGYLVARNVAIARTGWHDYKPSEVGIEGDRTLRVWRAPEEVFHPTTIASFEGKSVTDGHPYEFIGPSNEGSYGRGHAQHIRRGGAIDNGDEALLADLVIKDANLISKIEGGLREISCGYNCEYVPQEDGSYAQRSIRGNHIAVVPTGRAGDRVCIRDEKPEDRGRRPRTMSDWQKKIMGLGFKAFAKEAEPEEIAEATAFTRELDKRARTRTVDAEEEPDEEEKPAKKKESTDAKLARLTDAVEKLVARDAAAAKEKEKEESEPTEDSDLIPVETLAPDEIPTNPIPGADQAKDALVALKPLIARSKDAKAIVSWNNAWRALNPRKAGSTSDGYRRLLNTKKPEDVSNAETRATMRTTDKEVDPSADFVAQAKQYHRQNPNDVKLSISKGVN